MGQHFPKFDKSWPTFGSIWQHLPASELSYRRRRPKKKKRSASQPGLRWRIHLSLRLKRRRSFWLANEDSMNHICIPKSGDEQMNTIKRLRARSCLYRSRFLRVSTYVAIFFEIIFMIYALLHLPNLNMSAEYDNLLDKKLTNICQNLPNSFKICQTLAKTSPTFWKTFDTFDILEYIRLYLAHLI